MIWHMNYLLHKYPISKLFLISVAVSNSIILFISNESCLVIIFKTLTIKIKEQGLNAPEIWYRH